MDYERLKNGVAVLTKDYFEEQLQRIREIRLSERRFYQKITDIYATSIDYDSKSNVNPIPDIKHLVFQWTEQTFTNIGRSSTTVLAVQSNLVLDIDILYQSEWWDARFHAVGKYPGPTFRSLR